MMPWYVRTLFFKWLFIFESGVLTFDDNYTIKFLEIFLHLWFNGFHHEVSLEGPV